MSTAQSLGLGLTWGELTFASRPFLFMTASVCAVVRSRAPLVMFLKARTISRLWDGANELLAQVLNPEQAPRGNSPGEIDRQRIGTVEARYFQTIGPRIVHQDATDVVADLFPSLFDLGLESGDIDRYTVDVHMIRDLLPDQ